MLLSEFETHTGIYPDTLLYSVIEGAYMDGNWDSIAQFCHAYKFNEDGLATKIQEHANRVLWQLEEKHRTAQTENTALVQQLHKEIESLKSALDTELEWHRAEGVGTNLAQSNYEELAGASCVDKLSDQEAVELLSETFGFMPERIEVLHAVNTYERNRHCKLRVRDTLTRDPLYIATDWNYIRFDCAGCQWEMINGELVAYED